MSFFDQFKPRYKSQSVDTDKMGVAIYRAACELRSLGCDNLHEVLMDLMKHNGVYTCDSLIEGIRSHVEVKGAYSALRAYIEHYDPNGGLVSDYLVGLYKSCSLDSGLPVMNLKMHELHEEIAKLVNLAEFESEGKVFSSGEKAFQFQKSFTLSKKSLIKDARRNSFGLYALAKTKGLEVPMCLDGYYCPMDYLILLKGIQGVELKSEYCEFVEFKDYNKSHGKVFDFISYGDLKLGYKVSHRGNIFFFESNGGSTFLDLMKGKDNENVRVCRLDLRNQVFFELMCKLNEASEGQFESLLVKSGYSFAKGIHSEQQS